MPSVGLVWATPEAERLVAYCARVSSPRQDNPSIEGLLSYLVRHAHWSPFEMASMCVEIETTRAISAQILRHRSFSFQEFSQRYAEASGFDVYPARRQDAKNRQASVDDMPGRDRRWFEAVQRRHAAEGFELYDQALRRGIAKEQARFLLPMSTCTRIYMSGTLRSWIHYLDLRTESGTQLEHREVAEACSEIFSQQFPTIAHVVGLSLTARAPITEETGERDGTRMVQGQGDVPAPVR